MAQQSSGCSVKLTPLRALVVAAVFGGLAGWLLVVTANAFDVIPPEVPWTAPIGLILVAALVGALAYATHQGSRYAVSESSRSEPLPSWYWAKPPRWQARSWRGATSPSR